MGEKTKPSTDGSKEMKVEYVNEDKVKKDIEKYFEDNKLVDLRSYVGSKKDKNHKFDDAANLDIKVDSSNIDKFEQGMTIHLKEVEKEKVTVQKKRSKKPESKEVSEKTEHNADGVDEKTAGEEK